MPNNLTDWLKYLESLHPKTISLGLERTEQVKRRLGLNPSFPIIMVGGTNGKGSVCAMLERILNSAGYSVGCYTSPHLLSYNERIRVNLRQVSDDELCGSFENIESARGEVSLTYFEFGTLAAMQCFILHKVEVAILEVGLGGRLDAVNVFDSDCSIISSIDIDHTDYLGDTREQIAFEKAGIFRSKQVAICSDHDVPRAIITQALQTGSDLWCVGKEFGFKRHEDQWDFYSKGCSRNSLPFPALRGAFQLDNASAALACLDVLSSRFPVSMEAVRRGLVEVKLPGRFQIVPGRPSLILDVAHNPHAAHALAKNLSSLPPCRHTWGVFSMLMDKDIGGVVAALDQYIDTWLVAGLEGPRAATAARLENVLLINKVRGGIQVCNSISEALHFAYDAADENDRIIAFGSFYTVAEVMTSKGISVVF